MCGVFFTNSNLKSSELVQTEPQHPMSSAASSSGAAGMAPDWNWKGSVRVLALHCPLTLNGHLERVNTCLRATVNYCTVI